MSGPRRAGGRAERRRDGGPRDAGRSRRATLATGAAAALAAAALALAAPRGAEGQEAPALDRVEAAADSGRADRARSLLERWFESRAGEASPEARTRAEFLRARLTSDADSAARIYLRAAVDGGAGYGDRAWLRLAQLRLAAGEHRKALQALDRLRSDYPATDLTAESWLWTGRARRAAGEDAWACSAWERALEAAGSADGRIRRRVREALGGCGGAAADAAGAASGERPADPSPAPDSVAPAPADSAGPTPPDTAAPRSGWVVQLGAFRDRSGAEKLRRAVGEAIPDADPVVVSAGPDGELYRVQTRPPTDRAAARELARELEARQFSVILVRIGP